MDNDVQGTEYCIGFSSAITRAKELINRQRTTLGSHERIGVFRIFGRDAGFSALYTAYVTSARCVIPEAPYDLDALAAVLAEDHAAQPEPLRLRDHRRGRDLAGRARCRTSARPTPSATATRRTSARRWRPSCGADRDRDASPRELTYDLRSGEPDSLDSMVAITFANVAMDLIARRRDRAGWSRSSDGKYAHVALPDPSLGPRRVDVARMYNTERFRPRYDADRAGRPDCCCSRGVERGRSRRSGAPRCVATARGARA